MARLGKKLRKAFARRGEARDRVRALVKDAVRDNQGVTDGLVRNICTLARGGERVIYDSKVSSDKSFEHMKDVSPAVLVAGLVFGLFRANVDMSPEMEYLLGGGLSLGISSLFAYIKMRIKNKRKIIAMEE